MQPRAHALGHQLPLEELVQAFLADDRGVSRVRVRNCRWALMLLLDHWDSLPMTRDELIAFVQGQKRFLRSSHSRQTLWDILRVFYGWIKAQGYVVQTLPAMYWGRRRRGERRGRRIRNH